MKSVTIGTAVIAGLLFVAGWAGPSLGGTAYSIQVAAFTDKHSAEERAGEMNRRGYHAYVRLETVPGKGEWYRVYVEKFGSKAQADREAASLKALGLLDDCFVRAVTEDVAPPPPRKKEDVAVPPKREIATIPIPRRDGGGTSSRLHFLHVGSFKERENAEKNVAAFGRIGHKAFFVEEDNGRSRWFKVYIGEFANVNEAKKAGADLKGKGAVSYFKIIGFDRGGNPRTANLHASVSGASTSK
jgi:cell division protein FtsN